MIAAVRKALAARATGQTIPRIIFQDFVIAALILLLFFA